MKQIATLVCASIIVFLFTPGQTKAQPVNTHRSFTWDGWPANSVSQPAFYSNLGPDNVNVGLSFAFAGTPNANPVKTYTYANIGGGRTSSLKLEKLPGSEDTLYSTLTFNKDLTGLNMEINPYSNTYVVIMAYNLAGVRVPVAGAYDISVTDSVPRKGDTLINNSSKNIHIYFTAPVSRIIYKSIRTNAAVKGMEFALGAVSWYNAAAATPNPNLTYMCEGNEILLVLDASTSIDTTERSQLINAVESMLTTLQYYAVTPNYVAVVEFSQKARLSLDFTQISPASIAPGGAIYNYLHNTDGNGYYSTNALYGGYTNWSQAFKEALAKARVRKPNLMIFFTDGAPNKVYETNDGNSANLLYSASWNVNRTALYADTIKQLGTHIMGIGVDRINTTTQDFYFRYPIEMSNPVIYDFNTPPPSNISTADYVTVAAFPYLELVFKNLFVACMSSLPVDFKSVIVQQNGCNSNTVSWSMANESDAVLYEVQKSLDGSHFETIESIDLQTSSKKGNYSSADKKPAGQTIYYRILATLQSGKQVYSKTVLVQSNCSFASNLTIWPNPVRGNNISLQFTDSYTGTINVQVFDMQGRKVKAESVRKTQGTVQVQSDIQQLSRGFYTLVIYDPSNKILAQHKFIKQ